MPQGNRRPRRVSGGDLRAAVGRPERIGAGLTKDDAGVTGEMPPLSTATIYTSYGILNAGVSCRVDKLRCCTPRLRRQAGGGAKTVLPRVLLRGRRSNRHRPS